MKNKATNWIILVIAIVVMSVVILKQIADNWNIEREAFKTNNKILNTIKIGDSLESILSIIDSMGLSHIVEYSEDNINLENNEVIKKKTIDSNARPIQQLIDNKNLKKYRYVVWKESLKRQTFIIFEIADKRIVNKWIEINADPMRLDLPDVLVREAVKLGIIMTMGTDSDILNPSSYYSMATFYDFNFFDFYNKFDCCPWI